MKVAPMFALGPLLLGIVAWQTPLPDILTNDFAKLSAAKEIKVNYTLLLNGDSQGKFQLDLSKDKMFRLTQPSGFVLSDGQDLYTYTKATNSYTKVPLTDAELKKFVKRPEVVAWSPFFDKDFASQVVSSSVGPDVTRGSVHAKEVDYSVKGAKAPITVVIDEQLGVPRGFRFDSPKGKYLASASELEVLDSQATADKFAFNAPDGAKMTAAVAASGAAPTFGQVEQLMTDNCMPCHDASNQKAGFDLSAYDGVASAVTAGNSGGSLLIKALRGNGADLMPRGRAPLPEDQIKLIEHWIDNGAKRDQ